MSPVTLALLWLIAANLIAVLPTRDDHWRAAFLLMALGLPVALWLFHTHGALWTAAFLGVSVVALPLLGVSSLAALTAGTVLFGGKKVVEAVKAAKDLSAAAKP